MSEIKWKEITRKMVTNIPLSVEHESKSWKIYYFRIDEFETELKDFLIFLESINKSKEAVVSNYYECWMGKNVSANGVIIHGR